MSAGTRFGPYAIVSLLGTGGMGEVYRARDARLNRDVALKVLPEILAADPDRLSRFTREAQTLAALNHPNIAAIHGLEDHGGRQALVLELVEGPTLADRIAEGPLPLEEALPVAKQIAEALEAAHERGIVHRDLKPANVKVRPDGTVKVLDFGLAKAMSRADGGSIVASHPADVTASPTMMSPATMTVAGVVLGTAAYMSPEQARGKVVDHRADIWAFGCVLYEMLAGRRPFAGEEIAETLAAILRGEPDWNAVPASTPPGIQRLIRRCLQKDPRQRLQAIGDARIEVAETLSGHVEESAHAVSIASRTARVMPLAAASVIGALIAGAAAWALKPTPAGSEAVTRLIVANEPLDRRPPPAPGERVAPIVFTSRTAVALSPDGTTLVFRANAGAASLGWQLYLRRLDSLDATAIPGTAAAENPFFSPDGQWVGYYQEGELRRVPVAGGPATTIARLAARIHGASWGVNDVILFGGGDGLWRVPASGGTPEAVGATPADEYRRVFPHILPGGDAILFTRQKTVSRWTDAEILVRSLTGGDEKVLLSDAADARYVSSGHLLFMRRGTLMAAPFDPDRLVLTGGAVAVVSDVMQAINAGNTGDDTGAGQFAAAPNGTLVYITGGVPRDEARELVWVDRDGRSETIPVPRREYVSAVRLSPDGKRILAYTSQSAADDGNRLWAYDVERRVMTAMTSPEERVNWALWSPDGQRVASSLILAGRGVLTLRDADGTGKPERVDTVDGAISSWSRDGLLAFVRGTPATGADVWIVDLNTSDRRPRPLLETEAEERYPAFSPDGKWLAYVSDESGRYDVYIRPYPGPGPPTLVSPAGGIAPAWRGDGAELFYTVLGNNVAMHAVNVAVTSSGVSVGPSSLLFNGSFAAGGPARGYDVTADGKRFLMVRTVTAPVTRPRQMVLVQHWFDELKRLALSGGS